MNHRVAISSVTNRRNAERDFTPGIDRSGPSADRIWHFHQTLVNARADSAVKKHAKSKLLREVNRLGESVRTVVLPLVRSSVRTVSNRRAVPGPGLSDATTALSNWEKIHPASHANPHS